MLISQALAQDTPPVPAATTAETSVAVDPTLTPPDTQSILIQNVGMIILLVLMFYFLLIRPQQKRFKEHKLMIDALKVGDAIITAGGLVGKIDKIVDDKEIVVDLGNGMKVTAIRSTVQVREKPAAEPAKK
jgi:preprotein translocase subunit YajC